MSVDNVFCRGHYFMGPAAPVHTGDPGSPICSLRGSGRHCCWRIHCRACVLQTPLLGGCPFGGGTEGGNAQRELFFFLLDDEFDRIIVFFPHFDGCHPHPSLLTVPSLVPMGPLVMTTNPSFPIYRSDILHIAVIRSKVAQATTKNCMQKIAQRNSSAAAYRK